jgi:hypothetical protein
MTLHVNSIQFNANIIQIQLKKNEIKIDAKSIKKTLLWSFFLKPLKKHRLKK